MIVIMWGQRVRLQYMSRGGQLLHNGDHGDDIRGVGEATGGDSNNFPPSSLGGYVSVWWVLYLQPSPHGSIIRCTYKWF
jgi:hypothetical protein